MTRFFSIPQFRGQENHFDVSLAGLSASIPSDQDLATIDIDTLTSLTGAVDATVAAPPSTPSVTVAAGTDVDKTPIGEDVIKTCVTPKKVLGVQAALQGEDSRHRCSVKLLPFFFTREELNNSNTEGSHGKQRLDSNKLNSLKVLVFSKFPVESVVEKERIWKFIKTKINARCRATKFAKRDA